MDYNKVEDAVLKNAMNYFKESAVNFFGIDTKITEPETIIDAGSITYKIEAFYLEIYQIK